MTVGKQIEAMVTEVSRDHKGQWNYTAITEEQGNVFALQVFKIQFQAPLGFAHAGEAVTVTIHNQRVGSGQLLQG